MTDLISYPFRIDPAGSVVTIAQGSARQAAQVAGHVLACRQGERPLAPTYGLPDPAGSGIDEGMAIAVLDDCEPDIQVDAIRASQTTAGLIELDLDVSWAAVDPGPAPMGADVP